MSLEKNFSQLIKQIKIIIIRKKRRMNKYNEANRLIGSETILPVKSDSYLDKDRNQSSFKTFLFLIISKLELVAQPISHNTLKIEYIFSFKIS